MESALNNSINELNSIREKINELRSSGKQISENGLELLQSQLKNVSRTLALLEELETVNETVAVAEETIPVNIKQVVGMSLENVPVAETVEVIKQEEPKVVVSQKAKPAKEQKPDNSLGEKMKRKPIKDLKTAIGINEKFAFIKLFGGDATAWTNALQKLNSFSSYWEAEAMLSEFNQKYKWKEEDETLQTLMDLVERRYM